MKRTFLLLLWCIVLSAASHAATYNETLQIGQIITVSSLRPGASYSYANDYESSNPSVASVTVEANGTTSQQVPYGYDQWGKPTGYYTITYQNYKFTITALQSGTTTITLGWRNGSNWRVDRTYNITVVDVKSIVIPNDLSLSLGESYTFAPMIFDAGATTTLTWNSTNTSVATIDTNGLLTTKGLGNTTITCTAHNGVSAQCIVTVNPILAKSISLNDTQLELTEGETSSLVATVLPENTTSRSVKWSSTNSNVATVDGNGLVTAVASGSCSIVATTTDGSSQSASCQVNVISDYLYTNDAVGVPSGTLLLPIQLKNASSITGLQFELQLPEGVGVAKDKAGKLACTLSDRTTDHEIECRLLSNGNYQFVVFSGTSSPLTGIEGAIAYVTLNIGESMAIDEYCITIKEIELTKIDGEALHHKDMTSKLTLTEALVGDINGDSKVTVTDAVGIVNYILQRPPSVFITNAADVNGDGNITITDAVNVINIILNR